MANKIRIPWAYVALTLMFIAVGVGVSFMVYYSYGIRKTVLKDGSVCIPTGTDLKSQAAILFDEGFVKDSSDYLRFAKRFKYDRVYPGKYTLKKGMTCSQLLKIVNTGLQTTVKVPFNNIRNREKLAGVVGKRLEADSASLMELFTSDSIYNVYGLNDATFLSMFIPDTYEFYWNTSADEFISRMKQENNTFWSKKSRTEKLNAINMTKEQVSTLASIVIEESKAPSELAKIAGVYVNRLKKGMPLQADPTVKFAVGDPSIRRVLYKHLEVDSPYNTYKRAGLPPGPICVPPINAIDAVLDYEKHNLYYFCASPELNGLHLFAKTLKEHNKNAAAYAVALNKKGIR
ncbi:MAG: endolytic transglycosylase MltG [Rikenellaceae bacterium]